MNCEWVDGSNTEGLYQGDIVYAITDTAPFPQMVTAVFDGKTLIGGLPNYRLPVKRWLKGVCYEVEQ